MLEEIETGAGGHQIAPIEIERVIDGVELAVAPVLRVGGIVSRRPVGPRAALVIHNPGPEVGACVADQPPAVRSQAGIGRIPRPQAKAEPEFVGPRCWPALHLGAGQNHGQAAGHEEQKQDPQSHTAGEDSS